MSCSSSLRFFARGGSSQLARLRARTAWREQITSRAVARLPLSCNRRLAPESQCYACSELISTTIDSEESCRGFPPRA